MIAAVAVFGPVSPIFAQATRRPAAKPTGEQLAKANITYEVIDGESGYGYDVFVDGKRVIHQPNIPGVAGTAGFKTKEDSKRVAELVIKKIKNNEMPPSITEQELRQLKVID